MAQSLADKYSRFDCPRNKDRSRGDLVNLANDLEALFKRVGVYFSSDLQGYCYVLQLPADRSKNKPGKEKSLRIWFAYCDSEATFGKPEGVPTEPSTWEEVIKEIETHVRKLKGKN